MADASLPHSAADCTIILLAASASPKRGLRSVMDATAFFWSRYRGDSQAGRLGTRAYRPHEYLMESGQSGAGSDATALAGDAGRRVRDAGKAGGYRAPARGAVP